MALVMVMLVLVAITSITLWMVKQSTLSEGMARNQLDQEAARQAAESALRDAERDIMAPTMVARDNASCSRQTDEINPNDFSATCFQIWARYVAYEFYCLKIFPSQCS